VKVKVKVKVKVIPQTREKLRDPQRMGRSADFGNDFGFFWEDSPSTIQDGLQVKELGPEVKVKATRLHRRAAPELRYLREGQVIVGSRICRSSNRYPWRSDAE
jgi:hypothetical protein